ncbi:thioesterase superfamily protein [Sphingopyxis sp. FD7]|jgi:hypothetical protein|nr:thioesterase superfamily protein [Sphingopyxis sp. FD7]
MGKGDGISASAIRMDAEALNAFMAEAFPQSEPGSRGYVVSATPGLCARGWTRPTRRCVPAG